MPAVYLAAIMSSYRHRTATYSNSFKSAHR
ncbi:hypothetical protein NFD58_12580 [Staphylococcus epidermidis]|nr:hypothetical protein [Staphylococcus epidermidis]